MSELPCNRFRGGSESELVRFRFLSEGVAGEEAREVAAEASSKSMATEGDGEGSPVSWGVAA
jgi:hypothetical protein